VTIKHTKELSLRDATDSPDGIINYILNNGLQVLLKPVHTAPVVSNWVWYRVGGRNEQPGKTGISHWVEHMMFKGTPTFPKGRIMLEINRNGGVLNGFTGQDYTAYFETLPADRLELGLQIESDRMANSLIDPDEVASERTVIISEREGSENNPKWSLYEEVMATAFHVHPYGDMVIGWKEDLQNISRADLYEHYKMYYGPHNAILVIVGDIDTNRVRTQIDELFGLFPVSIPCMLRYGAGCIGPAHGRGCSVGRQLWRSGNPPQRPPLPGAG
jgi:zinc protease